MLSGLLDQFHLTNTRPCGSGCTDEPLADSPVPPLAPARPIMPPRKSNVSNGAEDGAESTPVRTTKNGTSVEVRMGNQQSMANALIHLTGPQPSKVHDCSSGKRSPAREHAGTEGSPTSLAQKRHSLRQLHCIEVSKTCTVWVRWDFDLGFSLATPGHHLVQAHLTDAPPAPTRTHSRAARRQ